MSVYASNQLPYSPKSSAYTVLGRATSNTTLTLSESLLNYTWVLLLGQAGESIQATHIIPVALFAEGGRWYLNAYATTARTIYATYSSATRITVAGRSAMNIVVVGVK